MAGSTDESAALWSLPPQHLKALADQGTVRAFPKNTIIISEGDRSDSMFIIQSGKVKVYLADESGKELLLSTHGPGSTSGK